MIDEEETYIRTALRAAVIQAAIDYEEAWAAYTHPKQPFKNRQEEDGARIHKGVAHQNLMVAIRALKEHW